ncbi:MAG TPA: D-alanyl-D-alanine carboxypeptidase family protein [Kiritimatiellia bacterium]|nr:D-alanyl-D-alanine carboxypeptidase family protein [Kiritimatiellia bacterium]
MNMKYFLACLTATLLCLASPSLAQGLPGRSADPYLGAIVIDAATGDVLFEDHADEQGYPASVIKLLDLLVILEQIDAGAVGLNDMVTITAEASTMGGSQVYLKEKEVFSVDDLLYALMVQSGNDAAVALAIQVAGTKEGFVEMMAERAKAIGMNSSSIHSCHGLPPGAGQEPDICTPRDIATLCRELLKHKDTLRYTSTVERGFRNDTFIMRNHNPLLSSFEGCDGFKTGFFSKAGYSMAVTAQRKGQRVIAVIIGSVDRKVRNAKAAELLSKGFLELGKRTKAVPKGTALPAGQVGPVRPSP